MKKLIFINGNIGSGKTALAEKLIWKIDNALQLSVDSFLQTNPFPPSRQQYLLVSKAVNSLIKSYFQTNIDTVVVDWVIFDKEYYEKIKRELDCKVYSFYLDVELEAILARMQEDIKIGKRNPDNVERAKEKHAYIHKEGFVNLKATNKTIEELIEKILKQTT